MNKITTLLLGAILSFVSIVPAPAVSAYTGVTTNVWHGEHPYYIRKRDENRRKRIQKQVKKYGYYTPDSESYFHPLYARRSVLHPFYRKGGTTNFIDGRYARWRGYLDPVQAHALSPDTYCSNFVYTRLTYHGQPVGYQCF